MEDHPDVDFGSPGPIVRFLEGFYEKGYEDKLIESIKRKPTSHTLWMLNRIINGTDGADKEGYISLLRLSIQHPNADHESRIAAEELLALH